MSTSSDLASSVQGESILHSNKIWLIQEEKSWATIYIELTLHCDDETFHMRYLTFNHFATARRKYLRPKGTCVSALRNHIRKHSSVAYSCQPVQLTWGDNATSHVEGTNIFEGVPTVS